MDSNIDLSQFLHEIGVGWVHGDCELQFPLGGVELARVLVSRSLESMSLRRPQLGSLQVVSVFGTVRIFFDGSRVIAHSFVEPAISFRNLSRFEIGRGATAGRD